MGVKSHSRLPLAELHPGAFAVFPRHAVNTSLAYCEIVLSMPDKVAPLRFLRAAPGKPFLEGTPKPYEEPKSLPDVLVLSYSHVPGPVQLAKNFPWTPQPGGGIANWNFWAMPAYKVPSSHAETAFAALAAMIGHPQLAINPQ